MNSPASTQPEAVPHSCGTCANWTRHSDERMAEHGECALREIGHYTHRYTECVLDPSRWSPKREGHACSA